MGLDKYRHKGRIDYLLALVFFILAGFGIVMIFSASVVIADRGYDDMYYFAKKQVLALGFGLIAMIIFSLFDYKKWKNYATTMLLITIVLLVTVFIPVIGIEGKGAHRWIDLGFMSFQPSELVKLTFLLYLAAWFSKKGREINKLSSGFIPFIAIIALVTILIMLEPDMGTMTIVAAIATVIFLISGVAWKYIILYIVGIVAAFRILIFIEPYRLERLKVFLNPAAAIQGAGYHINQAMLAIGSGGWLGMGFGQSRQKYLYLPEPHTDSIFAVIAEELGFVRIIILVALFVFIGWRGYQIALRAPDMFGRLIAAGITTWFIGQSFVNMGAMLGLLPLTGVTLPFISYGGTSLVMSLVAAGILLNISKKCV